MRVVVAGSSGLIGTSLVPVLRQAQHDVIRLVRGRAEAPDERGWDPERGVLDDDALAGADAVINLCGAGIGDKRWSAERKQLLVRSRVRTTQVLARAAAAHAVPVLLNGSAVGYYGDSGPKPVTEASAPGSDFLADLCAQWESATAPAAEAGVRVAHLRTGLVLAPSGGLLGQLRPLFSLCLGGRLGDGTQFMPWISLDDHVSAVQFVLETPEVSGPVNLSAPAPVTNAEFTRALAETLGRPAPWVVPAFAIRAVFGEMSVMLLGGQRALPTRLEAGGFTFQHPSVGAALAASAGR